MFNIYYINYEKAFEISMLIDNKIQEKSDVEKNIVGKLNGKASLNTDNIGNVPFLNKIFPKAGVDFSGEGSRTKKVADSFKVVSTKSTILDPIYRKAIEAKKLSDNKIGNLIKIRNVSLDITNEKEILATKSLLSGVLKQIPIDETGGIDITGLLEVLLKDSSYIFSGNFKDGTITFKIPMKVENEMESQYNVTDLEIGQVTLIGVYRGIYSKKGIDGKINRLQNLSNLSKPKLDDNIETEPEKKDDDNGNEDEKTHFIDVIAIIQELTIK
ncbi:hypothetical protein [Clostridium drakei]|uniref:Uncharacterized protein n=1 Tax=Clostridium drakei TaxID=332101 RepID=A0A2U8DXI2_9CLOT|nr:hypothetical protein [Clostridium drakei]AWI06762.1 hypothetical protein B9W14_20425 [Clostridium drakei]